MKTYILYILTILLLSLMSCSDDYYKDTGLANGKHDRTVYEQLLSDKNNFDSIRIAIDHCGLKHIFDGTDADYPEITFFGITNISVNQFLFNEVDDDWEPIYKGVRDIPVDVLSDMILSHVIVGKKAKDSFDYEIKGTLEGGTILETVNGVKLRIYRSKTDVNGTPDIGPERLNIHAQESGHIVRIASSDIELNNGYIHSLSNTYLWSNLK